MDSLCGRVLLAVQDFLRALLNVTSPQYSEFGARAQIL